MKPRLAALAVAALLAAAGCAGGDGTASPTTGGASSTTAAPPTSSTTTTLDPGQPTPPADDYAIGRRTLTVVDPSRPTAASPERDIEAATSRTIELLVLYPSAGPAGSDDAVDDAPVADGRFPVLEFSHGVTASGPAYAGFLQPLARAGYVVVAPTFPLTSGTGAWGDLSDYRNQPADVSFVLDEVLALDGKDGDPLAGHLATDAVAVAGHSLGAITSLGFVNSCCEDERIDAIVELSGVELPFDGGTFDDPPDLPTLLIHGQQDQTVPYSGSANAFRDLSGPRAFVTFPEGKHVDPVAEPTMRPVSEAAITAFLDLELRGDDTGWEALSVPAGVGRIEVAGGLPEPGNEASR